MSFFFSPRLVCAIAMYCDLCDVNILSINTYVLMFIEIMIMNVGGKHCGDRAQCMWWHQGAYVISS